MGVIQYEDWETTAEALTIGDAVEPIFADSTNDRPPPNED